MERIPFEIYKVIYRNLGIYDLIHCSRTCKRLHESVKQFKIKELIIDNNNSMISNWFYTDKPPDYYNCVFDDLNLSSLKRPPFILCCLKRLRILNSANRMKTFELKILNSFSELIELEIKLDGYVSDEIIELNNLKILSVDLSDSQFEELIAPKLFALHLDYLYTVDSYLDPIKFKYPQTITHLEVNNFYYHEHDLKQFENVISFKTSCKLFKNFFQLMPKIEEIHFTHLEEFINNIGLLSHLNNFINKETLKIYFFGLKYYDNQKICIHKFTNDGNNYYPTFTMKMKNYSLLASKLNWIIEINYDAILKHIDCLPTDWYDKFANIQIVHANQIKNQSQFTLFICSLKNLQRLELNNTSLNQEFYDSLPNVRTLTQLIHNEDEDLRINFDFINKIEFLQTLRSTQRLKINKVIKFFIKLRHLKKLSIVNEDEILAHKKNGLYHLTYSDKGESIEKFLCLSQLIDLYDEYS